jgi:hypothetical protein
MSSTTDSSPSGAKKAEPVFKWACLGVAVVALTAYGWMLNDMRLEVKALAPKVEKLAVTGEDVAVKLDKHLPRILAETEQTGKTIGTQLPPILERSEAAVDRLDDLSDHFEQYRDLMGVLHASSQNKPLFAYGTSILKFVGGQNATVGVKKPEPKQPLKRALPAKEWARRAEKDAFFLSLTGKSKADVLHGLARTRSAAPLYVQLADQAPRLLATWLQEAHPDSLGVP